MTAINQDYIKEALANGIGVCAPMAVTEAGNYLNVNGDVAAAGIARLLGAEKLYLVTDVPGVMVNRHVIDHLSLKKKQINYLKQRSSNQECSQKLKLLSRH